MRLLGMRVLGAWSCVLLAGCSPRGSAEDAGDGGIDSDCTRLPCGVCRYFMYDCCESHCCLNPIGAYCAYPEVCVSDEDCGDHEMCAPGPPEAACAMMICPA